jgi:hypothetical protein
MKSFLSGEKCANIIPSYRNAVSILSLLPHVILTRLYIKEAKIIAIIGALAYCSITPVYGAAITQLVIEDVGSTTAGGAYNEVLDGNSGGFKFNLPIDPATYDGVTGFDTDTGTPMSWQGLIQGPNVFTSGFLFAGVDVDIFTFGTINSTAPGSPFTGMGASGDITGGVFTISSLDWGAGPLSAGTLDPYPLSPDSGSFQVHWVEPGVNANEYFVSFQWSHLITEPEDPSGAFFGQNTIWILEGTATVIPLPPALYLFGTGLLGLVGMARRKAA